MIEWQPIETAPKDGTTVDLWVESTDEPVSLGRQWRVQDCEWYNGHWWQIGGAWPLDYKRENYGSRQIPLLWIRVPDPINPPVVTKDDTVREDWRKWRDQWRESTSGGLPGEEP